MTDQYFSGAGVLRGAPVPVRDSEAEDMQLAMALSLSQQDTMPLYESRPRPSGGGKASVRQGAPTESRGASAQHRDDRDPTMVAQDQALLQLSEIVASCEATGQPFIDPGFCPSPTALYVNGSCRRRNAQRLAIVQHFGAGEIEWHTAGEILQRPDDLQMEFASQEEMMATMVQFARAVEWRVFQDDPFPTDISQGGLGNCWFCGSLAAVAEKPQLIRRLFVDPFSEVGNLSPKSVYVIRVCDGGRWCYEIIDGLLPCNRNRMLAFSGARRNQLWVPLLEKAYAKLRGCYEAIEGGTPSEGLRLFTGWPSVVLELRPQPGQREEQADMGSALRTQALCPFAGEDLLWTRLESAYEARLIICGSCGHVEGISDDQYRSVGLSPSHCYSIVQVTSAQAGTLRLLKLRNPWGTGRKWNGRFSDSSQDWTPEIRAEVGANDLGAEGLFWMTLQDIRQYFSSVTICPYREGWAEARRHASFPELSVRGAQPAFLLTATAAADSLLSLMQPEERASRTMMTADLGLALFRVSPGQAPRAGSVMPSVAALTVTEAVHRKVQDTLVADVFLKEEETLLAVPLSFNQRSVGDFGGCEKPFTFACFSPHPVLVRPLEITAEAYRQALVAHVRRAGSKTQLFAGVSAYQSSDAGLTMLVENLSMSTVVFEGTLSGVFNMTLSRPTQVDEDGQLVLLSRDAVPPMHGMVVFVAASMPAGHNFTFRSKCSFNASGAANLHQPPLAEPVDYLHVPFFLEGAAQPRQAAPFWQQW